MRNMPIERLDGSCQRSEPRPPGALVRHASLLLTMLALGACAPGSVPLPTPVSSPAEPGSGKLLAGFARVDITPPVGYGLFGYGPEAKRAVGHRSRLYARSLVMKGANGELIAFAVTDLGLISTLLHRRAAERVAARTDGAIGADRLMLAATHTHSAPGHFLSAWPLNEFGSSVAGYDSVLTNWLADRIAVSVAEAYRTLVPARAGWDVTEVWGHTRNRAYEAYVTNSGLTSLRTAAPDWLPDDLHRAVNPRWTMLRVDIDPQRDGTYEPGGALSIFAIHGTGYPYGNDLYDADVHGLVAKRLEEVIDAQGEPAGAGDGRRGVHLFANGAEGDVSPDWPPESRCDPASLGPERRLGGPRTPRAKDDWQQPPPQNVGACMAAAKAYVRRLGRALGDTAVRIFRDLGASLTSDVEIERAFETLALVESADSLGVCGKAETGAATAAGAVDGRSRYLGWKMFGLFSLGIEPGGRSIDTSRTDCQRPKRTLLDDVQSRLVGRFDYSAFTQLAVVRLGDMLIGTVPGEASTVAGLRMMAAMQEARRTGGYGDRVTILGLANGDLRYVTTREEYWSQLYEGGSNIYGPGTAEMLAAELARLTASLTGGSSPPIVRVDSIEARPGTSYALGPERGPRPDALQYDQLPECRGDTVVVRWLDAPPGSMVAADGPIVAFERVGSGEPAIDDDIDVEVRALGGRKEGFLWEARYTPPKGVAPGDRFRVSLLRWDGAAPRIARCD